MLNQITRDLGRHSFIAAPQAPLPHDQGDPQASLPSRASALALAVVIIAGGCGHSPTAPVAERGPASQPSSQPASQPSSRPMSLVQTASISAQSLREHVYYLAGDELEGRGPATAGLDKAARYLVAELQKAGLRPAFEDSYRQPFEMLIGVQLGARNQLSQGKRAFTLGEHFVPYTFSAGGDVHGVPVFAGYGIRSKDHEYDDYAGLDVKGKVVIALAYEPGDDDPKSPFDGKRRTTHASVRSKVLLAREAGAVALLVVSDKLDPKAPGPVSKDGGIFAARISAQAAKQLLGFDVLKRKKAIDRSYAPNNAGPARAEVQLTIDIERKRRTVHNIAAIAGPAQAKEVVVLGAHYDHLGMGGEGSLSGTSEPRIHNGADDNASGTAAVLEVAKSLGPTAHKGQRKLLFIFFAGEEHGLLGSSHFVQHPPVPVGQMAAMINLDMVGRLRDQRMNFMGVKTAPEFEALARAAATARGLTGTYGGDGYGPSDHTAFYAKGVPVLFLFTGAHADYHKPSDDPDTLNYPGLAAVAAVAADVVGSLAQASQRPTYVKAPPPKKHGGGGYGPYFGSIPDFGEPVQGVKFSGVRSQSPADKAGVLKGDVLIEFGGLEVHNLQDFTIALRRCAPGDTVSLKVQRAGKVLEFSATLTRRE